MRRALLAIAATALSWTLIGLAAQAADPIQVLIITGNHHPAHKWKETTQALQDFLPSPRRIIVAVTTTPARDLTPENLAKYDVLLLNYRENAPTANAENTWTEANKKAFLDAVRGGKGLVVFHNASGAFANPNWAEFEKATAGGWRAQGNHGPKHEFVVKKTDVKHPISAGLPAQFNHAIDELYQNSLMVPGNVVLATAYSDPSKPRGTGKDEPVIWVNQYGSGRVFHIALGHDTTAMADSNFRAWMKRGVEWAGTGEVGSAAIPTRSRDEFAFVKGTVKVKGQPLAAGGMLTFITQLGRIKAAGPEVPVQAGGTYQGMARVGKNFVSLHPRPVRGQAPKIEQELTVEIKSGVNTFDFDFGG
jgi:type 1 glutamine amidotransferase